MLPVIRPATREDFADITDIYNAAGVGTTASFDLEEVSVEDRLQWWKQRRAMNHPVLVATVDETVLGFASYGPFRSKSGYRYTVEHGVYVSPEHHHSGLGRMLMTALIDHAHGHRVHVMMGVIDASNTASIAFHLKLGFVEVGRMVEVAHKFGCWQDAVLMQLTFS